MKIRFGDKLLNTTEAFEDGLTMVMEELMEMVVSQCPEEDAGFQWANAVVSDISDGKGAERCMNIRLQFGPEGYQPDWQVETFLIETDCDIWS